MPPVSRVNSSSGRNFPLTPIPESAPGPMNHSVPAARMAGSSVLNHRMSRTRVAVANQRYTLNLGAASAGTFTLSAAVGGNALGPTAGIAFNAAFGAIQTALEAIVGTGNVTVTGGPLPATVTIDFVGGLAGDTVTLTGAFGGLTGATPVLTATQAASAVAGGVGATGRRGGKVGPR